MCFFGECHLNSFTIEQLWVIYYQHINEITRDDCGFSFPFSADSMDLESEEEKKKIEEMFSRNTGEVDYYPDSIEIEMCGGPAEVYNDINDAIQDMKKSGEQYCDMDWEYLITQIINDKEEITEKNKVVRKNDVLNIDYARIAANLSSGFVLTNKVNKEPPENHYIFVDYLNVFSIIAAKIKNFYSFSHYDTNLLAMNQIKYELIKKYGKSNVFKIVFVIKTKDERKNTQEEINNFIAISHYLKVDIYICAQCFDFLGNSIIDNSKHCGKSRDDYFIFLLSRRMIQCGKSIIGILSNDRYSDIEETIVSVKDFNVMRINCGKVVSNIETINTKNELNENKKFIGDFLSVNKIKFIF